MKRSWLFALLLLAACPKDKPMPPDPVLQCPGSQKGRKKLYWGDLHVHTNYSFDAYFFNQLNGPNEAYAFAKGAPAGLPCGDVSDQACTTVKLDVPLDFTAVTDHSEYLAGFADQCGVGGAPPMNAAFCMTAGQIVIQTVKDLLSGAASPAQLSPLLGTRDTTDAWARTIAAADAANDPCQFTALPGYEYSAQPNGAMLHRNIVFHGSALPKQPVSFFDARNEWEMWNALDAVCPHGNGADCDYVSIPHNPNHSEGRMFGSTLAVGAPTQAQIEQRAQSDVLIEITQHKGASECQLGYSNPIGAEEDNACTFENANPICTGAASDPPYCRKECETDATDSSEGIPKGCTDRLDMVRDVLAEGLRVSPQYAGVNPYKLGLVGATDTHNGTPGNVREDTFRGNGGILDDSPTELLGAWGCKDGSASCSGSDRVFNQGAFKFNAGGLTAVWSEENTRDSIFAALKRREVYASSGPRIAVKLYAARGALPANLCDQLAVGVDPVEAGQVSAVPMGADLQSSGTGAPVLVARAVADPTLGTPLAHLEVIKGWVDADGQPHTRVFPFADGGTNPMPAADCSITVAGQAPELCGTFTDPAFDPAQRAFYYVRVRENRTCRWSTWKCVKAQIDCAQLDPATGALPGAMAGYEGCCHLQQSGGVYSGTNRFDTIEERAWTSPVWYTPAGG